MTQRLKTTAEFEATAAPDRSDPLYITLDALLMARDRGSLAPDEIRYAVSVHNDVLNRRSGTDRRGS